MMLLKKLGIPVLASLWLVAVLAGSYILMDYEFTPSKHDSSLVQLPMTSRVKARDGLTLVMFLHPDCPCSSAALTKLIDGQEKK